MVAGQLAQQLEVLGLAEKIGFVGGQQIDRGLDLGAVLPALQQLQILRVVAELMFAQALAQAAAQHGFFAGRNADAGRFEDEALEAAEFLFGDGGGGAMAQATSASLASALSLRRAMRTACSRHHSDSIGPGIGEPIR